MINPIAWLLLQILEIYSWVIIVMVIVSWLISFGVINTYNPLARSVVTVLHALTEPVLGPIRRVIPPIGGLDLSPLVAYFAIKFLEYVITWAAFRML